jgi:hypothetical protein
MQMNEHMVEVINTVRASPPGQEVAARHLKSGDVLVTADSPSTKQHLEEETWWTTVIARGIRVLGKQFTVIAHAVRGSRIDNQACLAEQ